MRRGTIAWAVLLVIAGSTTAGETSEVVSIVINGSYFSEPANLHFLVDVEPNEENRFLWVEADSGSLYRASEVTLNGAKEKRLHAFVFNSLPGGHYTLRAEVRSQSAVRGLATRLIVVAGTTSSAKRVSSTACIRTALDALLLSAQRHYFFSTAARIDAS